MNHLRQILAFFALTSAVLLSSCNSTSDKLYPQNDGFQNLLDSVVKIDVWKKTQKDGSNNIFRSVGSGVIMSEDGIVLTNSHVVDLYSEKIVVTLPNLERVNAKLLGWDHWTDLAIIKIDTDDLKKRGLKFSHASFGNSSDLKSGEVVYAVGTPFGFARTVTRGIVSNTNRFFEGRLLNDSGYETGNFNTWIQTDAAINPGNSGGPLVLTNGKVVGINTRAYLYSNNLGFSVPGDVAKYVTSKLSENSKVKRSYIGMQLAPLQDMEQFFEIDSNKGVLVKNVDVLSPAAEAGMVPGDIAMKINGKDIDGRFPEQLPDIMNSIAILDVGSSVEIEVLRAGKARKLSIKTEALESRVGTEFALEKWGVGIREITRTFARENKLDADSKFVVVGQRRGFPFDLSDVKNGDIIISINRKKVGSTDDLNAIYEDYLKNPKKLLLEVMRRHEIHFVIVSPEK